MIPVCETINAKVKTFSANELDNIWVQTSLLGGHADVFVTGHGQEFTLTGALRSRSLTHATYKRL